MRPLCWRAKFIITWENTTRHCPLLLVPEARSRQRVAYLELRNMWKLSSVSVSSNVSVWRLVLSGVYRGVAKAIDRYIQARSAEQAGEGKIDPKLQGIIEGIFRRCIADGEYRQVCRL